MLPLHLPAKHQRSEARNHARPVWKAQSKKRLRHATIAFSYRHYVAAYPSDRLHRAVPPYQTDTLPSGGEWLHEIKPDGFRLEGIVSKRKEFALPFGPLARLAQDEEPGSAGREARSGRGLGTGRVAIKETAKTLLVVAVLAVLAAATAFMMVELWKSASQMREGRRGEWLYGPAP